MIPSRQEQLDMLDAYHLHKAARIVRARAKRPGFWLDVYCKVLTKLADSIVSPR